MRFKPPMEPTRPPKSPKPMRQRKHPKRSRQRNRALAIQLGIETTVIQAALRKNPLRRTPFSTHQSRVDGGFKTAAASPIQSAAFRLTIRKD
jgi:hypothetical protein